MLLGENSLKGKKSNPITGLDRLWRRVRLPDYKTIGT